MYIKLFQSQTKAIRILQKAQRTTEDMYIESEPEPDTDEKLFRLLKKDDDSENEPPDETE